MKTCVVIDDEPLAIKLLESYIDKLDKLDLKKSFTNPLEALSFLQENRVDIIFCDIQMPELNGIQLAKLTGAKSHVIFTIAYAEYAVEGFELNAVDYLVKPITFERFLKSVERVLNRNASNESELNQSEFIFVKTEYRHQKVNFSDIKYLKSFGDYVQIYNKDSKIMTLENLKHFEQTLPTDRFMRIHRSYIIALDKIDFVEKSRVFVDGESISISATYLDTFRNKMGLK